MQSNLNNNQNKQPSNGTSTSTNNALAEVNEQTPQNADASDPTHNVASELKTEKSNDRPGRKSSPTSAGRKKLNALLAAKKANDNNIKKLQAEIAAIKEANKKIDADMALLKKDITASLFKSANTDDFTKIMDGLTNTDVSAVEILRLVVNRDFEKLAKLFQK